MTRDDWATLIVAMALAFGAVTVAILVAVD